MKSTIRLWWLARLTVVGCTTLLLYPHASSAASTFWSNPAGGNYTNTANWLGGTVPGPADIANFTNNASYSISWTSDVTNSNAFFNAQSGTVTLNASPRTWSLLDTLTVGQAGATGSVTHSSGTFVITNGTGLGALVVGEAGRGTYTLGGGTVIADRLLVTNLIATGTNSIFTFNGGTLTTLNGSEIRAGASLFTGALGLQVGSGATPANWSMLGGSNVVLANNLYVGMNSDNRILVSGPSTTFDFSGSIFWLGITGNGNQLVISNGGRVNMTLSSQATLGYTAGGNIVTVTGSNSLWSLPGSELGIGRGTGQDQVIVTNGGEIRSSNIRMGELANSNIVRVTGTGSRWLMTGTMIVGYQGATNLLYVTDGGVVSNGAMRLGQFASSTGNRVEVSGAGSLLYAPELHVGSNSTTKGTGIVIIKDGGTLQSGSLVSGGLVGGVASGVISNSGGIYQFTGNDPNVAPTSPNSIVLNGGTISYRGINNASVFGNVTGTRLTNMTFMGDNGFRLNNSSNAAGVVTYTFNTGLGATNYSRLELQNGGRWRSTTLNIGGGGSLIGNGIVESTSVTNLGTIAPGFSAGLLTFTSNLVLGTSSRLEMEIGGTNAVDYDRLIVAGNLTITGALQVVALDGFSPTLGTTFTLIENSGTGTTSGQFNGLTNGAFLDASSAFFHIWYDGGTGNDVVLIATIPEPSTLAFLGIAAYALLRRKSNRE